MAIYNTGQTAEPAAADQLLDMRPKQTALQKVQAFVRTKPLGAFSAAIIILTILTAVFSGVISPYDPLDLEHEPFAAPQAGSAVGSGRVGEGRAEPHYLWGAGIDVCGADERDHRDHDRGR